MWSSVIKQVLGIVERFFPSITAYFVGKKTAKQEVQIKTQEKSDEIVKESLDASATTNADVVRDKYTRRD